MLSEGIHSLADMANQLLLAIGIRVFILLSFSFLLNHKEEFVTKTKQDNFV
jgi:hypothetical protein